MKELQNLYSGLKSNCSNALCEGCTILEESKPDYAIMDYESLVEGPVLFLSDSLRYKNGQFQAFSNQELKVIENIYPYGNAQYAASVKCPSVKEKDMTPENMKLCREHLEATVDKVKPRLIYACGNLAMKMLKIRSGIMNKRGSSYEFTTNSGYDCIVVPIYHPYTVLKEPRHRYLFETDIKNAYEKYVLGKKSTSKFTYNVATQIEEVKDIYDELHDSEDTIAVDIETTGLNFKTDQIMTIAISCQDKTWVIPCNHKDSPFRQPDYEQPQDAVFDWDSDYTLMWNYLAEILENPKNKKVFHNAKFDLKFLLREYITPTNVWDTKIMHHLINENAPKSLMDLVKLYFADELENL